MSPKDDALSADRLWILRTFAADYYCGQWCRWYRIMCRADNLMRLRDQHARTDSYRQHTMQRSRSTGLYRQLEKTYGQGGCHV